MQKPSMRSVVTALRRLGAKCSVSKSGSKYYTCTFAPAGRPDLTVHVKPSEIDIELRGDFAGHVVYQIPGVFDEYLKKTGYDSELSRLESQYYFLEEVKKTTGAKEVLPMEDFSPLLVLKYDMDPQSAAKAINTTKNILRYNMKIEGIYAEMPCILNLRAEKGIQKISTSEAENPAVAKHQVLEWIKLLGSP